jgi:beta-mannosidase
MCPASSQHGECHVNFIRKMQCSFSWDWGPTFASSGIVRDIELQIGNEIRIQHVMADIRKLDQIEGGDQPFHRWQIDVRLVLDSLTYSKFSFRTKFALNNVTLTPSSNGPTIDDKTNQDDTLLKFRLITADNMRLLPWFPNGFDYLAINRTYYRPNLHDLTVTLLDAGQLSRTMHSKTIRIGLREVELEQVTLQTGYSFYFRVQGFPVYMRGTNYIPSTLSIGHVPLEKARIARLMLEAKNAHLNMIRVWGGGIYDLDYLYDLADEYGKNRNVPIKQFKRKNFDAQLMAIYSRSLTPRYFDLAGFNVCRRSVSNRRRYTQFGQERSARANSTTSASCQYRRLGGK